MPVFISLLRGVNVGGNKKIKMASLRDLHASLGLHQTQTLLQSGNAVFRADFTDARLIVARIQKGILQAHEGPEIVRFCGDEVDIHYPNGAGQSKLSNNALEKSLKITGTARNWNTVNRLVDFVRAFEAP